MANAIRAWKLEAEKRGCGQQCPVRFLQKRVLAIHRPTSDKFA